MALVVEHDDETRVGMAGRDASHVEQQLKVKGVLADACSLHCRRPVAERRVLCAYALVCLDLHGRCDLDRRHRTGSACGHAVGHYLSLLAEVPRQSPELRTGLAFEGSC